MGYRLDVGTPEPGEQTASLWFLRGRWGCLRVWRATGAEQLVWGCGRIRCGRAAKQFLRFGSHVPLGSAEQLVPTLEPVQHYPRLFALRVIVLFQNLCAERLHVRKRVPHPKLPPLTAHLTHGV